MGLRTEQMKNPQYKIRSLLVSSKQRFAIVLYHH